MHTPKLGSTLPQAVSSRVLWAEVLQHAQTTDSHGDDLLAWGYVQSALTWGLLLEALSSSVVMPCWEGSGSVAPFSNAVTWLAIANTCCIAAAHHTHLAIPFGSHLPE